MPHLYLLKEVDACHKGKSNIDNFKRSRWSLMHALSLVYLIALAPTILTCWFLLKFVNPQSSLALWQKTKYCFVQLWSWEVEQGLDFTPSQKQGPNQQCLLGAYTDSLMFLWVIVSIQASARSISSHNSIVPLWTDILRGHITLEVVWGLEGMGLLKSWPPRKLPQTKNGSKAQQMLSDSMLGFLRTSKIELSKTLSFSQEITCELYSPPLSTFVCCPLPFLLSRLPFSPWESIHDQNNLCSHASSWLGIGRNATTIQNLTVYLCNVYSACFVQYWHSCMWFSFLFADSRVKFWSKFWENEANLQSICLLWNQGIPAIGTVWTTWSLWSITEIQMQTSQLGACQLTKNEHLILVSWK